MRFATIKVVAAAAVIAGIGSAQAAIVSYDGQAPGGVMVTVGATNLPAPQDFVTASAGTMKLTVDNVALLSYCVELTQYANASSLPYTLGLASAYFTSNYSPDLTAENLVTDRLGRLFTHLSVVPGTGIASVIGAPTTALIGAAIQLAVWESIYEDNVALSLGSGKFQQIHSGKKAEDAEAIANGYLSAAAAVTGIEYSLGVFLNPSAQDYLVLTRPQQLQPQQRVPEPASMALVAVALAGLGLTKRQTA